MVWRMDRRANENATTRWDWRTLELLPLKVLHKQQYLLAQPPASAVRTRRLTQACQGNPARVWPLTDHTKALCGELGQRLRTGASVAPRPAGSLYKRVSETRGASRRRCRPGRRSCRRAVWREP